MSVTDDVKKIFEKLPHALVAEKANGLQATIQLNLTGEGGGDWHITIDNGQLSTSPGLAAQPDLTLDMPATDYVALTKGQSNPMGLFMAGKIRLAGSTALAMKFQELFDRNLVQ